MKLREFNFNSIKRPFGLTGLSIRMETSPGQFGPWYQEATIGETLRKLPKEFADAEIKETRWFFDTFVIELKKGGCRLHDSAFMRCCGHCIDGNCRDILE